MSFGLNLSDLPSASSYDEALRLWASIVPLRGNLDIDPRPLGYRASANPKTVQRKSSGAVVFTYHNTDVITWHPDGTCEFQPWESRSTATFADSYLPAGFRPGGECDSLDAPDGVYKLSGARVYIQPDGEGYKLACPEGSDQPYGTEPISYKRVNRKRANAIYREHNLPAFITYLRAFDAMYQPDGHNPRSHRMAISEVVEHIKAGNRESWPQIARAITTGWRSPQQRIADLRTYLREQAGDAYDYYTEVCVATWDEYQNARASMRTDYERFI